MVRSDGGESIEDFLKHGVVAIGWGHLGDLSQYANRKEIREALQQNDPDYKPGSGVIHSGVIYRFAHEILVGDNVVTYDPDSRTYHLGEVKSTYRYEPGVVPDKPHIVNVEWRRQINRDSLSLSARNSLGSTVTLFTPSDDAARELMAGEVKAPIVQDIDETIELIAEHQQLLRDVLSRSKEFIKDAIVKLSEDDMERLVAALLRSMGYKARRTPKGRDRGRDVMASPDGLGFLDPRIIAEVKHRSQTKIGAPEVRSFLGALRDDDHGLYVSTGGFTMEARYEAERAMNHVELLNLDELVDLVLENYSKFDVEARTLVRLTTVYWPLGDEA